MCIQTPLGLSGDLNGRVYLKPGIHSGLLRDVGMGLKTSAVSSALFLKLASILRNKR